LADADENEEDAPRDVDHDSRVHTVPSRRASLVIEQAALEEAAVVIANGYLRLDPQQWIRAVEKRRAALGR
jgi:hypothetical protein